MPVTTSKSYATTLPEDDRWIAECLGGNTDAFGLLVRKYQDRLYCALLQMTGSEEDARDVAQDAFIRAFEALDSFQGNAKFYTWLYRIAFNAAISLQRRRKPAASVEGMREISGQEPVEHSADSDPVACAQRGDISVHVRAALSRLSEEYRSVLVLREMEGLSYEEMAGVLQCPVGTVRSRLFRARLELRGLLEHVWQDQADSSGDGQAMA